MESQTLIHRAHPGLRVDRSELPERLRPFIHEIYEEEFSVPDGQTARVTVSATTEPFLNVTLSGHVVVKLGGGFKIPPVTIAGPQPEAYEVEVSGKNRAFYIRFATVGPLALLGITDYRLPEGGALPLHKMVRPDIADETRRWSQALLKAPSFEARADLASKYLMAHCSELTPRIAFLQAAVEAIEQEHGNLRMSELARRLGASVSTLRRHFRVLGMPPKHFSNVMRFRHAHAYLHTTPGATWADVVDRFGYADQPHFVRDYRRFSGGPPTQWEPEARIIDRRMGIENSPDGQI